MWTSPAQLAAQLVRALPRKQMSRLVGRLASRRVPTPVLDAAIAAYVGAYEVDMGEVEVPRGGFRTFDEFFTRRLKLGARQVDPDHRALVSPADGRIEGFGQLTKDAELRRCSRSHGPRARAWGVPFGLYRGRHDTAGVHARY